MAVELTDSASGITLPLWNAQELRKEQDAGVDAYSAMSFDSENTFLTSLDQGEQISLTGEVTANRLTRDSRFSSDERTALAEWAVKLEAFIDGGQGGGYTLERNYVGDSFQGVIEAAQWTTRGGEPYSLDWNLTFLRGEGSSVEKTVAPDSVTPGGNWEIDGYTVSYPTEFQMEKSQTFEVYRRALAEDGSDNDIFPETGARRRITIIADVTGDESTRETFYDNITTSFGQNDTVTVRDALTGREFTGVIGSFDTTDESGLTRLGEFSMEIVQGEVK